MYLYQQLLETLPKQPAPVRRVLVGAHWTLVCSRTCGLASTLLTSGPHGHARVREVGFLHQKDTRGLAEMILSEDLLEASIGMAAINSMIEVDEGCLVKVNASEIIAREGKGKNVAIIGHFPFIEQIKHIPENCWVIEKKPFGNEFAEDASETILPEADVVAITGTAFINHTMDRLLSLCKKESTVLILGPSTPLTPMLFDHGVSYLSGARVDDVEEAVMTISQGAILPQVRGIRLVSMAKGQ